MFDFATIHNTAKRCAAEGIPLAECALRRLVRDGDIPASLLGNKAMIYWPNVLRFIENGNNAASDEPEQQYSDIRPVEV